MSTTMPVFLSAKWHHLVMLNYKIDPSLLTPLLPSGCELDIIDSQAMISIVGFKFLDLKALGIPVLGCRAFDQINLRFYVKCGNKRGVVFIKEICPKSLVSTAAKISFNEQYYTMPVDSHISPHKATYRYYLNKQWTEISLTLDTSLYTPEPGSEENFVVERYWGYTSQRDGSTKEFEVKHPPWRVAKGVKHFISAEFSQLYDARFTEILKKEPSSTFIVDGSKVSLHFAKRLKHSSA